MRFDNNQMEIAINYLAILNLGEPLQGKPSDYRARFRRTFFDDEKKTPKGTEGYKLKWARYFSYYAEV